MNEDRNWTLKNRVCITTMLIFSRCVICMIEFVFGDHVRYLPCLHTYHTKCIDDWLMRSFICPSCMEPVDAALLITYESQSWTKNELRLCVHTCAMCGRTCVRLEKGLPCQICVSCWTIIQNNDVKNHLRIKWKCKYLNESIVSFFFNKDQRLQSKCNTQMFRTENIWNDYN